MGKLFKKAIVFIITASFVFNSGLTEIISYAKTIDVGPVFEVAKSVLTDFVVKDGVLEKYNGSDKVVKMPKDVICIGEGAFKDNDKIEEVVLSENVESIEKDSFKNCKNLKKISFNENLDSIGESTFEGCENLKAIIIPECVESIKDNAFKGCKSLESLVILNKDLEFDFDMLEKTENIVFYGKKNSKLEESAKEKDYKFEEIVLGENISLDKSKLFTTQSEVSSLSVDLEKQESISKNSNTSENDEAVNDSINTSNTSRADASGSTSEGFTYTVDNSEVTITRYTGGDTQIVIPSEIDGMKVTAIGSYAFSRCDALESITIPKGVKTIGEEAFSYCYALESITIPEGVTSIANSTFLDCEGLKSITIPDSVTSIGEWAFSYCYVLESITIPEGVTSIEKGAFYSCSTLESITIPEGVTSIAVSTFNGCSALKSVTIPKSVTSIGEYAFDSCRTLESITIPEGVTSIKNSTFNDCRALKSVTIPESVTLIEEYAFQWCKGLESITIPKNVTTIESYAFWDCDALKSITLPEGLTDIGDYTFSNCVALESITLPEGLTYMGSYAFSGCSALESIKIPKSLTSIAAEAFSGCGGLKSIILQEGLTTIGRGAFSACGVESITFPKSLTLIGESAFSGCSTLDNIIIPESITTIEEYTFSHCSALKSITFPQGLETIGNAAFSHCTALESITIPTNVTTIGASAFYGCSVLKNITIPKGVTAIENYVFYDCDALESITIPENVTSIGNYAFSRCNILNNITIPEGVTSIGTYAFSECIALESITLPKSVTDIQDGTFRGCSVLKNITIPESVTSIGNAAFMKCIALESITIPKSVTTIKNEAFRECSILKNITLSEGLKTIGTSAFRDCIALESITIPKGVTAIGKDIFRDCSVLKSVILSEGLTTIGESAFRECRALKSITIPGSVTDIQGYTFYDCTGLESITISKGVTSIGEWAFVYCISLESITIPGSVTSIGEGAFYTCRGLKSVKLAEGVTSIEKWSFSECDNLTEIYMPNSIEKIDIEVFKKSPNLTMHVYKDSVSETYAIDNNISYVYRDYEDPIVIIPGVMGSRLFSDTVNYNQVSLIWEPLSDLEDVAGLIYTYNNLNDLGNRLVGDVYVKPPQIQQFLEPHKDSFGLEKREYGALDTYKKLVDELCKSTERPVYFFSYNWMKSNSDNADKLKEFLEPFDNVDLVCHSMGGIVASSYMSKYKSDGKVDKIVTCGTPYEGSPAIINKMQNWDILEDDDTLIFKKDKAGDIIGDIGLGLIGGLTKEVKTKHIVSAPELVPSENYVSRVPMYAEYGGLIYKLSFDKYKTICKGIFKEKYDDGLIFQESIKGSTGYNNLLDYDNAYFVIGTNQKTITSIKFYQSMVSDDIGDVSLIYEDDLKYESKGDGTVPYISATISEAVKKLPGDRYCFADGNHTKIVKDAKIIDENGKITDKTTIEWIKQKLEITDGAKALADDTTSSKEPKGSDYIVFRIACPVDVNIEANGEALDSSASELYTQTSFGRLDIIGQNDDIKMLCVDKRDDYDVILNGTGEGTMDYTIRYFNSDDELQSETTINDVPITKDTIITTKPVSTEDTVLNVDVDGDGTVDKTYIAPKGETVDVEKVVKFNPNNGDQEIKRAVDSEGKLNYTPEAPTSEGYTFVGWFKDTDDITTKYKPGATYTKDVTYTAKWAHVDMLGAQVKAVVDEKSGIRFGTRIYNDGDEIVEKGTIILPARLLPDGESLTLDTPRIAKSVGKVNYEVNEEKNYVTYLGTLVNIPRAQFDAEITASAYVIYKDKAGNEYTVYSPYKKGSTTINKLLNS